MKNEIYSLILLFCLVVLCNSCNYKNSKNSCSIEIEFEGTANGIDTIIENFKKLDLHSLEIKLLTDTNVNLTFMSNFDSAILSKIFKNSSIEFQETFDFVRLADDIDTIMLGLTDFESEIVWKKNESKSDASSTDIINKKSYYIGPQIGIFLVEDTSEISSYLNSTKARERLPSDLVFSWGKLVNPDSLSLYMIKANSIEKGLSQGSITNIAMARREKKYHSEYDKCDMPNDFNSELYYEIIFTFDSNVETQLYEFSRQNVGHYIVIKLNGSIFTAAQVSMPIEGGQISFTTDLRQDIIKFYKSILFHDVDKSIKINKFKIH